MNLLVLELELKKKANKKTLNFIWSLNFKKKRNKNLQLCLELENAYNTRSQNKQTKPLKC
jgi:hypothetical protein